LTPNKRNRTISHLGQSYESVTEFCDYFGINRPTAYSRLRRGWDLDDVINKPALYSVKIEYNGNSYSSISALCAELKLPYKLIYKRLTVFGWSIKDAVEKLKNVGRSISVGKKAFKSLKAAAKHYGVPAGLLQWRLSTGWPIEKAVDQNAAVSNRKPIEIDGEYFSDTASAARAYGLNPTTFIARINRSGWTIEQAAGLEEPPANEKGPVPVAPENYIKRLKEVHGDNLDFSNAKFGKAQGKVEVRCMGSVEHANFWATPNNLLRGKGCPICKISHGARKIAQF